MDLRTVGMVALASCCLSLNVSCKKTLAAAPPPPAPKPTAATPPASKPSVVAVAQKPAAPAPTSPIAVAPASPAPVKPSLEGLLSKDLQNAYFDFDNANLRPDARSALMADATALKSIVKEFPKAHLQIQGDCDERGSAEYNLALGDRRATDAKEFLVNLGVPADRLTTISYGKERPVCTESNESCWQMNRRAHIDQGQ